jgi:hypothetical protein
MVFPTYVAAELLSLLLHSIAGLAAMSQCDCPCLLCLWLPGEAREAVVARPTVGAEFAELLC